MELSETIMIQHHTLDHIVIDQIRQEKAIKEIITGIKAFLKKIILAEYRNPITEFAEQNQKKEAFYGREAMEYKVARLPTSRIRYLDHNSQDVLEISQHQKTAERKFGISL